LGRTGFDVSEVGFGAWAIGADWGDVPEEQAIATVHAALDAGVNFFDTADVYGDGRSERILSSVRKDRAGERMIIATKAGRRLDPHSADGYNAENLTGFIDRSLRNLDAEALDLVQLHCPPTEVYYRPEVFEVLDRLVAAGKILHYGVSVEKVEEALKAIEYPGVKTVQIIFNMLRQRPAGLFFAEAQRRRVGILARVPLASGLLTGKMTPTSTFAADDHRSYNRAGDAFDVGETFAGVPFEVGLEAVDRFRALLPDGLTMPAFALAWILQFDPVSTVIPGAKRPDQVASNIAAGGIQIDESVMEEVRRVYDEVVAPHVHHRW
jgi:aryl-alcohol dehydrogenase-like predicted oxidoreductase